MSVGGCGFAWGDAVSPMPKWLDTMVGKSHGVCVWGAIFGVGL